MMIRTWKGWAASQRSVSEGGEDIILLRSKNNKKKYAEGASERTAAVSRMLYDHGAMMHIIRTPVWHQEEIRRARAGHHEVGVETGLVRYWFRLGPVTRARHDQSHYRRRSRRCRNSTVFTFIKIFILTRTSPPTPPTHSNTDYTVFKTITLLCSVLQLFFSFHKINTIDFIQNQ